MIWSPCSSDFNPIENFWPIIKRDVYATGRQFTSKIVLWEAINTAARTVPRATIKKLTDSMTTIFFDVIKRTGAHNDVRQY